MREGNKLTALKVSRLKERGRYSDGHGLWLQVSESGSKAWIFRYKLHGRARHMGLGALHTVNLAEARIRARQVRQLLLDGHDPLAMKRNARMAAALEAARVTTFKQCTDDYIAAHSISWKNAKHRHQWQSSIERYAFPIIGDLPVGEIDTTLVLKVLRPIWQEKPETAYRVRGRIERILSFWSATQKVPRDNPARWRGHLDTLLPAKAKVRAVQHHPAMSVVELPGFMSELQGRDGMPARALEFCILTASRTGEVLGARWDEFDLSSMTWTIPADRTKANRKHVVPLSDDAITLLDALPRDGAQFVFFGMRGRMTHDAMGKILSGMRPELTVHGFRSTFRDWAGDRTAYPRDVIETALAHSLRDKTEAAYRRGSALEKRRRLMAEWARYCYSPVATGEVVALRG
jgi:integrase